MTWTNLGRWLPWLRGQAVHLAVQDTQQLIAETAISAGFTVSTGGAGTAAEPYRGIVAALRLPSAAEANLDALADALRDLPMHWTASSRLALLVPDAHSLIRTDLLGWTQLCQVLDQASATLWEREEFVFETVFLVPAGRYGADSAG